MSATIHVNIRGEEQQYPTSSDNSENGCALKWDDSYVRQHWGGRLKIIEIITTFLAALLVPAETFGHPTRFQFFAILAWVSFICCVIDISLHLCSLWPRLPYIFRAPEVHMSLCSLAAFGFVLGAGLLTDVAAYSGSKKGQVTAACLFGFASMAFFGVEALLHFLSFRQNEPPFPSSPKPEQFHGVMM